MSFLINKEFFQMKLNNLLIKTLISHISRIEIVLYFSFAGNWYRAGKNSKNLLHMMIMRSRKPCKLTAGKIYLMSLENFSAVVKTSMSYFTVLLSFR